MPKLCPSVNSFRVVARPPRVGSRRIRIPVLVTAGSNDLILPEETKKVADHLPNAETVIVDGADHGSYIAVSPVMGELLLSFFERKNNEEFT